MNALLLTRRVGCCVPAVLVVALIGASPLALAGEASASFGKTPAVAKGIAAFPRLAASDASAAKINAALAKGDARVKASSRSCRADAHGKGEWTRTVEVTMSGPRFISYVASDDYFCGGAYPDTSVQALVYDLATGIPVDWASFLPKNLAADKGTTKGPDGTVLGTVSSPALSALYVEAVKPGDIDPQCTDAPGSQTLHFLVWPNANENGLSLQQTDLPHVAAACGPAATIPMAELRKAGVDTALLDAIETAYKAAK